ncbi:MAG: hypothetical protein ACRCZ0_04505 [Cetobacterium sp.]
MIAFSERMMGLIKCVEFDGEEYDIARDVEYAISFNREDLFQVEWHQSFTIGTKYYTLEDCELLVEALNGCAKQGGVYEI